jgi:NAD(P)-dependent dehydrogenase (short-subunit alcohol dehydrogenase family)
MGAYSASKHAVIGFTKAAAAELGDKGVNVNALCPAYIDTDMMQSGVERAMRSKGISQAEATKAVLSSVNQRRLLGVQEVSDWVVQLCGPASSALNGQVIVLDGGGNAA